MKLETKRKGNILTSSMIGLAVLIIVNIVVNGNPEKFGAFGHFLTANNVLQIAAGLLVLLLIWGPNSLVYDDTDEVVIIKTKRLIYGDLFGEKSINYEIPRRKIRRVRLSSKWFKKYLHITINGKKEVHRIQKIDATLLSSKDLERMISNLESIATKQHSDRKRK